MTQFEGHLKVKKGVYTLQFETTDYEKYKFMEKAAQEMMAQAKKEREGQG